jgi:hypothetical protein
MPDYVADFAFRAKITFYAPAPPGRERLLIDRGEAVISKADFTEFARLLLQNYRSHPDEWENGSLDLFLEGLAGFVEKMDAYYQNVGLEMDLERPSWRVFADILLAARVYE